ncbi:glycosyltransferase [Candidatus Falkowbacteria bacterium]|nr:glycosyltransferase [Candidatus Falkowbacteria bacterium]
MAQKILQINKFYYPWLGGVETVVKDIADSLNGQPGWQVDVLVCQAKGRRAVESINGATVYRAASYGKLLGMPLSLDFFHLLKKLWNNYDQIIIHHPFPLAFLALPFLTKKPLVTWYHCDIVRQKISKLPFLPFINYGLRQAKLILASSQRLIDFSKPLHRFKNKCQVVYFGLELDDYQLSEPIKNQAQAIRQKYAVNDKLILSIGRLVYYKGFKYLIEAMKDNNYGLLIVGQGPEEASLRQLIDRHNLGERVKIIPAVEDTCPYYAASDLFVLPSCANSEAFGIVQLEAMVYGKPVINTALPTGVPEVSLDDQTGLTVPPQDSAALATAIKKILDNPALAKGYGQAAGQRLAKVFDKRLFVQRLVDLLRD